MSMPFREKRLRAYEAGTITGNTAYMFSTVDEYVDGEAESNNWTSEQKKDWKRYLQKFMNPSQKFIREKLVGCHTMLEFFTGSEVNEVLKAYEAEIEKVAAENEL